MLREVQNIVLKMLAEGVQPSKAIEALCLWLEAQLPETIASVLLVDATGRLQPCAAPSLDPSFIKEIAGQKIGAFQGTCGAAAFTGKAVTDIDLDRAERWRGFAHLARPQGLSACFSSPVLSRAGKVVGTLALYFKESRGPTPLEESIIEGCLPLCMIALEQKERVAEMERLAFTDSLTGLSNRAAFRRRMDAEHDGFRSLLLIDLDNLKQVNDTFGHRVGDELIAATGKHLSLLVPEGQAFRVGGDEFALVLDGAQPDEVLQLAERVRLVSNAAVFCAGVKVFPSVTIGVAMKEATAPADIDLLQQADQALYQGKEFARGSFTLFDASIATSMSKRNQAIQSVTQALAEQRVEAWYQPISRLDTRQLVGVEALARIRLADGSVLAAQQFHEATKDAQVAGELTRQMISCIARDISNWLNEATPFQHVGINISASDLLDDELVTFLTSAFAAAGIPHKHIILEITESVYLGDRNGKVACQIRKLREAGFKIALDDFGTGYASLTHLLTVPVDIIKIDKSFIDLLGQDDAGTAIVEGVLHITRGMGIKVVAEGIETERQEQLLLERGCILGQGYLYAKAVPALEAAALLRGKGQTIG